MISEYTHTKDKTLTASINGVRTSPLLSHAFVKEEYYIAYKTDGALKMERCITSKPSPVNQPTS